jgi:hypothetical protein
LKRGGEPLFWLAITLLPYLHKFSFHKRTWTKRGQV